ncbi:UNVERIFIED_CONTAM: Microtubule-associated protein 70-2 [Sesamum indicum]
MGSYQNCINGEAEPQRLTSSASFKAKKKPTPAISRAGSEVDDIITLLHGSDPVRVELTRLENEVREKDRELGEAHAEIKALKFSERLKEKAVEENLEIKKINEEKKAALAAQFAAEATLRRVHAAQKDDEMPPIEAIITPLEAELKLARLEVAKLQDDNRALDRLTKSKEAALLEAERAVQMALAKASLVDDLQNKNQELNKQIEICQEEKRILDRELARAKVSANRVAVVVANDWKDANDKVMPVKQWLEERKFYQMLAKKVETLNKAMEVEAKKMRREVAAMEKEVATMRNGKDHDQRNRRPSATRGAVVGSHAQPIR